MVLFDDFTTATLSSVWNTPYNGPSYAAQTGIFLDAHTVTKGDSWLRLQAYPDPANALSSWQATPAVVASVNAWCGAGIQTVTRFAGDFVMTWACKWDTYPAVTPIVLTMGNAWPPEVDVSEINSPTRGAAVTNGTASFHYASGNSQVQPNYNLHGADLSQPHIWQLTRAGASYAISIDGAVVVELALTPAMLGAPNGLDQPQFLAFQLQTGDPSNPAADATVTASSPITMYVDWVQVVQ